MPNTSKVFDSSQIPGEIIDMMVVNTKTLKDNPKLGKALVGAWYEIMSTMSKNDKPGKKARNMMAAASGTDLAGYDSQLASTKMFYMAKDAVAFTKSKDLIKTMKYVSQFSFDHGLLGEGAQDANFIGIEYPGGVVEGNKSNLKLRFNADYMGMAAEGKL
jgi:NitT/TauT family transport system substrate-binding protein